MYYVLSLMGFECYSPVWFASKYSEKAFKIAVKKTMQSIIKKVLKNPNPEHDTGFINGHTVLGSWNPEIKYYLRDKMESQGFHMIEPDYELTFEGECLYNKGYKKPPIFSKKDWEKILKHNIAVRDDLYKEIKK